MKIDAVAGVPLETQEGYLPEVFPVRFQGYCYPVTAVHIEQDLLKAGWTRLTWLALDLEKRLKV